MKFDEFDLNEDLLKGIEKIGFAECMKVQEETLKHTLKNRDAYVQSQTGSGKTAAFLITIFEHFKRQDTPRKRALIIVPTRELAVQIEREAKDIGSFLPYRIGSVYGGVGYAEQIKMLEEGYEVLIGTPGRLLDLEQSKRLNLRDTSVLVIDEADRLFDMGFLPDIRKMLRKMPDSSKRMTMLFSATLNTRVWQVSWEYMSDPVEIAMNPEQLTVDEITQELYHISRDEKVSLLLGILKKEEPENVLIFSNTKSGAYDLAQRLTHNGYPCQFIIGDLPQKKRIKVIDQLKAGELKYLVATDVAARGLHVDDLSLVVNYDIPEDPENYVHRIGRTARAGNTGKAISLACERFVYGLEAIEKLIDMKIPVVRVEDDLVVEDKSAGMYFNRYRDSETTGPGRGSNRGSARGQSRGQTRTGSAPLRSSRSRPPVRTPRKPDRPPERTRHKPDRPSERTPPKPERTPIARKPRQERVREQPQARVGRDMQIEDRLEYYKKKYGENFSPGTKPSPDPHPPKKGKKGLIKGLFKRKSK
jgi:ATP-dependent RNA helicase RhlB